MTGPTTAGQLLDLAAEELNGLRRAALTERAAPAAELAAAWPAFHRAGERLIAALRGDPAPDEPRSPGPVADAPLTASRPDPRLQRAADLVGAAADLLATRDQQALPAEQRAANTAHAGRQLTGAAQLVTATTAAEPALLSTVMSAATAAASWSRSLPTSERNPGSIAPIEAGIALADASTVLTRPGEPGPTHTDRVAAAIRDWQDAALAAVRRPAPSREDLRSTALTCGGLLALSQRLLRAHHRAQQTPEQAVAVTIERVRQAGQTWNAAADSWQSTATGGVRASPELLRARAALEQAVQHYAAAAPPRPTGPPAAENAARALHLACGALAAVQAVAEQHSPLIARLAQTTALYAAARQLAPSRERLAARLAGRWIPVPAAECPRPMLAAYQALPAATAAARLSYASLTSPVSPDPAGPTGPVPGTASRELTGPAAPPPVAGPRTLAVQRWQQTLTDLDPRLQPSDSHYPALAAALDRVALAGVDVPASLTAATLTPLPDEHTARALHHQLTEVCAAAITPYTEPARTPPIPARTVPHPAAPRPTAPQPGPRR